MSARYAPIFAAVMAIVLASCSERKLERCPQASVLVDTGMLTVLRPGAAPDPANAIYSAQIVRAKQDCDLPKFGSKLVQASVDIDFRATRPNGSGQAVYTVPYFVAITTEGKILAKREFTIQFTFDQGASVANFSDSVNSLQISVGRDKKPTDYGILVGFQLSKGQLEYNRKIGRYVP